MDLLALAVALLAGILTFLNPCVLPILPLVFAASANEHRFGPAVLAAGLALSFTAAGLFVATIGVSLGIDPDLLRVLSAGLLIVFGALLALPRAQYALQTAMGPVADWGSRRSEEHDRRGLGGQFGLGLLLGAVWSPCVGPTLGAATLLASQGDRLAVAALTMSVFGIGAAIPLLLIGTVLRPRMAAMLKGLGAAGRAGKVLLGSGMIVAGAFVLTGLDKRFETLLVETSPAWLIDLTTRF
ncbi:cytochrome c biogenesis CcdA family protein [Erythrobacter sp. HL-111]|uniref:cytochrome c biogenesis CcdA family protein n=1 Tax=Erythrobacter sp. HL-111 TaxID=1798193 RepID=UPI0006DA2D4D|nr:cytochrome c biogenesis CcdA family protein [Erythrobacter sp. HL-111]KPP92921.1 MAG: Cytochrome c biogenesis protein [Erythrobacteraceae bacterium HL-111]SDT01883.1 Cytochrome c biogenesis protein CcdA [Erythrobacter sp. HL-111]